MSKLFPAETLEDRLIDAAEKLKFDMQFAIQAAMKSKGVSQKEVAELIGCSPSNISQLLAEDANPRVETVAKVLTALGEKYGFATATLNGELLVQAIEGGAAVENRLRTLQENIKELAEKISSWEGLKEASSGTRILRKQSLRERDWYVSLGGATGKGAFGSSSFIHSSLTKRSSELRRVKC